MHKQRGFHIVEVIIGIVVIGLIGFIAWRIMSSQGNSAASSSPTRTEQATQPGPPMADIAWQWTGAAWTASGGTPPECPSPLGFKSPVDVSTIESILYPGQTRGGNYKPHGGFKLKGTSNDTAVIAPIDAKLALGSRYIEQGETQYLLFFVHPCGMAYRFDHLLTLTPAIQKVVDTLPAAQVDDSRTTNFTEPIDVKAGETIATAVGFKKNANNSFDLGVYDLRTTNEASKSSAYKAAHVNDASQALHAICWFDLLSSTDAATVRSLPATDQTSAKTSDYCK